MKADTTLAASAALGHDIEVRRYVADEGVVPTAQPLLAFPSMNGRVWDWEGYGMVESIRHLIDAGRISLYVTDSIDWQSWTAQEVPLPNRAKRHADFDRYLSGELLPRIASETGRPTAWATGCSMGGFHSASIFFRHPEQVDGVIAMSGVYQLSRFIGDYADDEVVAASPLLHLRQETDPDRLERYRRAKIVLCVGQGPWEDDMVADTRAMEAALAAHRIPAFVDYWGHDVAHDWYWWQRMLPYHLERLLNSASG